MYLDPANIIQTTISLSEKLQTSIIYITLSISLYGRYKSPVSTHVFPGPGQYESKSQLANPYNSPKMINHTQKSRVKKNYNVPGPGTYGSVKEFAKNYGPKFTFGSCKKSLVFFRSSTPGPGTYPAKNLMGSEGRRYTMLSKSKIDFLSFDNSSPGPGTYKASLNKSSPSYSMGKAAARMKIKLSIAPSPTKYNPSFKSASTSSPNWKIAGRLKDNTPISMTPEPSKYTLPSTVGIGPKISFHQRLSLRKKEESPGPGAYTPSTKIVIESQPGVVINSGPTRGKTLFTNKRVPGPGTYTVGSTLSGPKYGFGVGRRCEYKQTQCAPGPGAYHVPCTFANVENYKIPTKNLAFSFV